MGLMSRIKEWNDGDILTEADLEAEFDQIYDGIIQASTTAKGMVELATNAEVVTGTDTERAVTSAGLSNKLGSAATRDAEDTMTDGAKLPDGAAIKTYGDSNWSSSSSTVVANSAAKAALSPTIGDLAFQTDETATYICINI